MLRSTQNKIPSYDADQSARREKIAVRHALLMPFIFAFCGLPLDVHLDRRRLDSGVAEEVLVIGLAVELLPLLMGLLLASISIALLMLALRLLLIFRALPLRFLGGSGCGITSPVTTGGGGTRGGGTGGTPLLTSAVPVSGGLGASEARGSGVPVAAGGVDEAGLNGSRAILVGARELLLLNLVLSLGLRVTVCNLLAKLVMIGLSRRADIQK